ncbi:MAG: hypothetical protein J7L63_00095 [Thermoplasmata archaeon]|uniref:KaiC-like domain-containing protein n=1 Tax=Candidatus Aciduliprofundum boonei TaxID=379547 RepID=A0A7J3TAZ8_9ARCH|nr:hypothetical protein [Thermoplasmata archaeon]HHE75748.1 hypothetical protein [Candidatus Aciduliprofundum boonei]
MSVSSRIVDKLSELPPASSLALYIDVNSYFDSLRALVDIFATKNDLYVFYISSMIPSRNIVGIFELLGIDSSRVFFVDTISHLMPVKTEYSDKFLYIESPTMLENIMLKVEYLLRKYSDKKAIVILDSVNSMAIHNDLKILSEFLHIFVTFLRNWESYMVIISLEEQTTEDIRNMLNFVTDEVLEVKGE